MRSMSKDPTTPTNGQAVSSKEERLSAALRENLKRRKAQSRLRQGGLSAERTSAQEVGGGPESSEKDKN